MQMNYGAVSVDEQCAALTERQHDYELQHYAAAIDLRVAEAVIAADGTSEEEKELARRAADRSRESMAALEASHAIIVAELKTLANVGEERG